MGAVEQAMERTWNAGQLLLKLIRFAVLKKRRLIHNFNAGPSILPKEVFEQASQAILNFSNTGLSILEIGHRTSLFEGVMDEARSLVKELMQLNDDKEILFLHGGASTQFFQVPMNLLDDHEMAAYLDCGVWGTKAIKEAKLFGTVETVASSKDRNYTYVPKDYQVPANAKYFHYTSNNTIEGTEMFHIPETNVPLVVDMSSDILSRQMDFNRFSLIYAGAQKNIGAAGVNLVVIDKNFKGVINRKLPAMMDYRQHIVNGSMLNTPPVFAVYVCMLTLRWLKSIGGISAIEKINQQKADMVYSMLDAHPLFRPTVAKEDRSRMNVVFVMDDAEKEKQFLELCKKENMVGVKGHRSVGGFRVSLYNALPLESAKAFCDLAQSFN
jgi:phosphoserine aminotransferase